MAAPPLDIYYPNGGTSAAQMFIWDGAKPILWDGSVTFSGSLPSTVAGNLTNNNAAPAATNLGALTALANAAAPSWTEGKQVLLSTDLAGNLRVAATISTAGLATSAKQDTGNTSLASIDTKTPSLGQALAAASVPIVLTALQLTTLTPPAAITGFATSANQTNASQKTQIVDGSGNVISATSNALDVNLKTSSITLAVSGPLTDTQLRASAVPISAASLPLPTLASTSTKQSDGSQKTQIVDGSGNVIGATSNALDINIKSGNITGFATSTKQSDGSQKTQIVDGSGNVIASIDNELLVRTAMQGPVAKRFTATHVPATNVQATATKASAGSGKRNVCTGFTFTLASGAAAPTAAAPIIVSIIDGASGGGTYLWRSYINIPAVAGAQASLVRSGLWLPGSQNTAMTLEFSAADGANTYESVTMDGIEITE